MFGSTVLEVGIGLTFMFLLVSLACSAMREMIESILKSRASDLEKGIVEILGARATPEDLKRFYDHPLISCLYQNDYKPSRKFDKNPGQGSHGSDGEIGIIWLWALFKRRQNLPTYIPPANFAVAALSVLAAKGEDAAASKSGTAPPKPADVLSVASLRDSIAKIENNDQLKTMVLAALDGAQDDITAVRKNLEAWYNSSMDRVSGIYKRRTQWITFGLGLFAAVVFNIDAIRVARHLATDDTYREAVVKDAAAFLKAPGPEGQIADGKTLDERLTKVRVQVEQSGFAVGWACTPATKCKEADQHPNDPEKEAAVNRPFNGFSTLGGWLVTALAVSLGAPFWFDVLNKFMVVRSTVKPAEKSGQEASKDSSGDPSPAAGKPVPVTLLVQNAAPGGPGTSGS